MKRALRDAVRAERAWVFEGATRAGTLERTEHGARFVYEPAFLAACTARGRGLAFRLGTDAAVVETRGVNLPVTYKGSLVDCGCRLDLVIESRILIELKAVERLLPIHEAQVLTYLKLANLEVGLLVNFNVPVLRQGLRRLQIFPPSPLPVPISP